MPEFETLDPSLEEALGRFNRMVQGIRPELHKYCSRMTGSVLDGEDLVQEVLAHAYYKLSMMKQNVPLRLWLFKIAHNKCIDFLRSRRGYALVPLDEHAEDLTIPEDEVENRSWSVMRCRPLYTRCLPRSEPASS